MHERFWQQALSAGLVGTVLALSTGGAACAAPASKGGAGSVPFEDLRVFAEVFGRIKSDYVERVPDKKTLASYSLDAKVLKAMRRAMNKVFWKSLTRK